MSTKQPSIFGVQSPKVVFETATITLDYSIIIQDRPVPDLILHESIINRHREWVVLGKHWVFEINLLLFKYTTGAAAKYAAVKAMEGGYVDQLFRRTDGVALKDSSSTLIRFLVEEVSETYLDTPDFPDILRIRFISENYIDITKSIKP